MKILTLSILCMEKTEVFIISAVMVMPCLHANRGLISPEHKLNDVVNYTKLALLKIYHLESNISQPSIHYQMIASWQKYSAENLIIFY